MEKSKRLYEILQTRVGSYEILMTALQDTKQSGAVKILKDHTPVFRQYGKILYDKNHVLGSGCSGTKVFKGTFGGRDVAVKVMNSDLIDPEMAVKEVDFLKRLDNHENILRYFTAETNENFIYIALELCVINFQDEMTAKLVRMDAVQILQKCTSGLVHLHNHNIVHRDLKPANVLINQYHQVKISDFGLSKQIPLGKTSVTAHSGAVGTANWAAPEMLKLQSGANATISTPSAIFSLGCIFYFVLTNGLHPFGDISITRQYNILSGNHKTNISMISPVWLRLIKTMLAPNHRDRPAGSDVLVFVNSQCESDQHNTTKATPFTKIEAIHYGDSEDKQYGPITFEHNTSHTVAEPYMDFKDAASSNVEDIREGSDNCEKMSQEIFAKGDRRSIRTGKFEKFLQEYRGIYNAVDIKGNNALFHAVTMGFCKQELEEIVRLGGEWDIRNKGGESILECAIKSENVDDIKYFISIGADVNTINDYSKLFQACVKTEHGLQLLKYLLENKLDSSKSENAANDVLFWAMAGDHTIETITDIILLGGNLNSRNKERSTILHRLAAVGNLRGFQLAVHFGAETNVLDSNKNLPFHYQQLWETRFMETLNFAVKFDFDFDAANGNGDNMVLLAAGWNISKDQIAYIVTACRRWSVQNKKGETVLHISAKTGNVKGLKNFLSLGADINAVDYSGDKPLHKCDWTNFEQIVAVLLRHGANMNDRNKNGKTLRTKLERWGARPLLTILEKYEKE